MFFLLVLEKTPLKLRQNKCGVYATTASRAILQVGPTNLLYTTLDFGLRKAFARVRSIQSINGATDYHHLFVLMSFGAGLPMVSGLLPQLSKISVRCSSKICHSWIQRILL